MYTFLVQNPFKSDIIWQNIPKFVKNGPNEVIVSNGKEALVGTYVSILNNNIRITYYTLYSIYTQHIPYISMATFDLIDRAQ